MPRRFSCELLKVENVAASKVAQIEIPTNKRLLKLKFEHGFASGTNTIAGAVSNISKVEFKLNDRVQRSLSGQELRDLNLLFGTAYDVYGGVPNTSPGCAFTMHFAEPWRKDVRDQLATALPLRWKGGEFDSAKLQITLGAASTPTLRVWGFFDDVVPDLGGMASPVFTKHMPADFNAGGTQFSITNLDKLGFLNQITFYPDSGGANAASRVQLLRDNQPIFELYRETNLSHLIDHGMVPTASGRSSNVFDMVLDYDDLISGAENLQDGQDTVLKISAGSAMSGTVRAIIQRSGPME